MQKRCRKDTVRRILVLAGKYAQKRQPKAIAILETRTEDEQGTEEPVPLPHGAARPNYQPLL